MCDPQDLSLKKRHSFYESSSNESWKLYTGSHCKSDANLILSNETVNQGFFVNKDGVITSSENSGCGEYYKERYGHDLVPAKVDSASYDVTSTESGNGEGIPLTQSRLDNLEKNVFSNISHELPASSSSSGLDSGVRYFRNTVEEIFDRFYASMADLEHYKKRYDAIVSRNREDSVEEMEEFIKDMIHHIMSSDSWDFNEGRLCTVADRGVGGESRGPASVLEAFKNDSYLTDSTEEPSRSKPESKHKSRQDEEFCSYLLSPCVEIKTDKRKLLSEINLSRLRAHHEPSMQAASAEDIKKVAAKRLALERYERQNDASATRPCDKEIPVKSSYAKKNIHLDEDFDTETQPNEKSFISRICNYLCKRLRKTSIV